MMMGKRYGASVVIDGPSHHLHPQDSMAKAVSTAFRDMIQATADAGVWPDWRSLEVREERDSARNLATFQLSVRAR